MSDRKPLLTAVSPVVPLDPRIAALGDWWRDPQTWTIFLGHGTRDAEGARELLALVEAARAARPGANVETGALEFHGPILPSIQSAFDRAVAAGARRIVAQPVLLFEAGHARRDIPAHIAFARKRHPGVEIHLGRHIGVHPALLDLVQARARAAAAALPPRAPGPMALLVVGRGTTDARANAAAAEIARLLWETGDWAFAEYCFAGVAPPDVAMGLRRCLRLGAVRVVVAPLLINTGVLMRRVEAATEQVRREAVTAGLPEPAIAVAGHFGVDPRLIDLLWERAGRALAGGCPRHRFQLTARVPWQPGPHGHHHHHDLPLVASTDQWPAVSSAEDDHAQEDHGDPTAWSRGESRWHEF